jgi:ABC-type branched-subunit amino acid transport system ATPase component
MKLRLSSTASNNKVLPLLSSSKNAVAALRLADRALILDMGNIVFDGSAQEVMDNEELRHEYLAI